MSLLPGKKLPDEIFQLWPGTDKWLHFLVYGIWAFLFFLWKGWNFKWKWQVIFILALYGILLEVAQELFFSGRLFEISDIVANCTGLAFAYMLYGIILKTRSNGIGI